MALTDSEVTTSPVLARPYPSSLFVIFIACVLIDLSEPLRDVLVMLSCASLSTELLLAAC